MTDTLIVEDDKEASATVEAPAKTLRPLTGRRIASIIVAATVVLVASIGAGALLKATHSPETHRVCQTATGHATVGNATSC